MSRYRAILLVAMAVARAHGDVGLSVGASGALGPEPTPDGEIRLCATADWLRRATDAVAALADVAVGLDYSPQDSTLAASADLTGDLSVENGPMLWRLRVGARGEAAAAWASAVADAPWGEASGALLASWSGLALALQAEPAVRVLGGDRLRWGPSLRLGVSGMVGRSLILSADLSGSLDVPVQGTVEPGLFLEARMEWFTQAPVVLSGRVGLGRRLSEATETFVVGGVSVEVPDEWGYLMAAGGMGLTALLGAGVDLALDIPATFRLYDRGVVTETAVLAEREWRLGIEPSLDVAFDLARRFSVSCTISDELVISNARDPENVLTLAVEARLLWP